jgi:hypothetical protein
MLAHLLAAFSRLFTTRRSQLVVGLLVVVTATLPVAEMLVLKLFSSLIINGPETFTQDTNDAILKIGIFFLAFGVTRAAHHLIRLVRVRVFRDGFDVSGRTRSPSQESWEWALAFELSGVLVSLVQAVMFAALFLFIDWPTGVLNLLVSVVVLALVSAIYRRQLSLQRTYVTVGHRPVSVAIPQRVGDRVRDAEFGAMLASAAMVLVLAYMLLRTLLGDITTADAIVLFLGLRLLAGQLGTLSSSIMRFARASARQGDG